MVKLDFFFLASFKIGNGPLSSVINFCVGGLDGDYFSEVNLISYAVSDFI